MRYLCIEGPDRTGKSTTIQLMSRMLFKAQIPHRIIKEPSKQLWLDLEKGTPPQIAFRQDRKRLERQNRLDKQYMDIKLWIYDRSYLSTAVYQYPKLLDRHEDALPLLKELASDYDRLPAFTYTILFIGSPLAENKDFEEQHELYLKLGHILSYDISFTKKYLTRKLHYISDAKDTENIARNILTMIDRDSSL